MSGTDSIPEVDEIDPQALELAAELRGVIKALATHEIDPDAMTLAAALARQLRQTIDGPPKLRWYDGGGEIAMLSSEARIAYLEQSPIRGHLNPIAPPLEIERATRADGTAIMIGRTRLGLAYEGPPHGVHGGWVAALFDEMLGLVQGLAGTQGVTAILTIKFRHVTPVDEDLRFESWVHQQRGRRLVAKATCHAGDTLTADAEGIFIRVDFDEVRARMQQRRSA
jgi:acyl-coenzyme A thioesterase PaaI-like protein